MGLEEKDSYVTCLVMVQWFILILQKFEQYEIFVHYVNVNDIGRSLKVARYITANLVTIRIYS